MKTQSKKSLKHTVAMLCMLLSSVVYAQQSVTIIDQGSCGNSLTWVLTDDSTLTISGSDTMPDYYDWAGGTPWEAYKSDIATIIIGDSITSIGDYAFKYCINLTAVTIPSSITRFGSYAFGSCRSLTSVIIPKSVTNWRDMVFDNCLSLNSVIFENGLKSIGGWYAFTGCDSLTSITIPNSVTSIGHAAFYICENLKSVTLSDSLTSIEDVTFSWCTSLTSITIPNSVTYIGGHAFSFSGLTSITIPNNVATIRQWAFDGCANLTSVIIGNSVTIIEDFAFYNCNNLSSLVVHAVIPPVLLVAPYSGGRFFDGVPDTIPVYIPCGTYNDYRTAWSYFSNFIEMPTPTDTGFYTANFSQGEFYSDNNFTNLTEEGKYCITLQNDNGCDSVVCLDLRYDYTDISEVTSCELQVTSYEIYDILGRNLTASLRGLSVAEVRSNPEKAPFNSPEGGKYSPPLEGLGEVLPAGIYILKLYTNQGIIIRKIINL